MQAASRHDIGRAAEDSRGSLFHVHQFVKPDRSFRMIEEQVNVGIRPGLAARG